MAGSILGNEVLRTEDPPLLAGHTRFLDDVELERPLHVLFVRSTMAHARIRSIDSAEAASMPGVEAIFTAADLDLSPAQFMMIYPPTLNRPPLARDVARFVGDPVAVVVAESTQQAVDAAERVDVEYEPLPAVVDPDAALNPDAPLVLPDHGSNVAFAVPSGHDDALFATADVVIEGRFVNQRLAPTPMEPNGAAAEPDVDTGGVRLWASCQQPFAVRTAVATHLGLEPEKVHVIVPAVGGGFGAKGVFYVEHLIICRIALALNRAVKWVETRSENMVAMTHGRGQTQTVQLGATRDGTVVGLRANVVQDAGAYPVLGAFLPMLTGMMSCGPYRIPKVEFGVRSALTNTAPVSMYRGAGRPEATALIERSMDLLAHELGIDPAELRRRNLIDKDSFPHATVTGTSYDTGDYALALEEALRLADYERLREDQQRRRECGDMSQLGIGLGLYVEITGGNETFEYGAVQVHPDGAITVKTGTSPQGQGHETAWAQIVADTLGIPMEGIQVLHSDTRLVERGQGTHGSRSAQQGGSAVLQASQAIVTKARELAAHLLEAALDDIVIHDGGRVGVAGSPNSSLSWAEIAQAAEDAEGLPGGMAPGLQAVAEFEQAGGTFPFGCHISVVEVDVETGLVTPVRHIAVDDCGRVLNPMLARGQVHGGIAQGIAQALHEEFLYDDAGNPLTSTLLTYELPSAAEFPSFETTHTVTPTPLNPLGAKGIGESGTIGSTPAVQNAVIDALTHLGVRHIDMPLTPERVWRAIHAVRHGTTENR